ncbi:MAG: response regulator [Candidatus Electrothrix sp. AX5]|nr:response regulator [Candidatus Electrothrix sp. AX5]
MTQQSRKSVLIIDDEADWLQLYKDILGDEFFLVSASSEEDARQKITAQDPPFHVVVTDVRLEDWNKQNRSGLDLIYKEIRSKGTYTESIVITGYDAEDTALQAKELLQAYAYMLKGDFDYKLFRKLVNEAAEKAEQQRCVSKIWILELDDVLREKMTDVLSRQYNVRSFATSNDFLKEANRQMHGTLCLNTNLLSGDLNLLKKIQHDMPELKITLMTDPQTEAIVKAIQNHSIENIVTLDSDEFSEATLDAAVRRSLVSEETKYVTISIEGAENNEPLQQGHTYKLTLKLHKYSRPGELPIWLPPKETKTVLRVIVDAPRMTRQPEDRIFWEIPPDVDSLSNSLVEITPRVSGEVTLTIYIEHGEFQLGQLQKK